MGFFNQNAQFVQPATAVAEAGIYECALVNIEVTDRPKFNSEEMEPNFRWVFETTEVGDEEGKAFRFSHFTKAKYGPDQAKLTILLDQMLGKRLSQEEFSNLDIAELKGKKWAVEVTVALNNRGYENNTVVAVKPVRAVKKLIN